MSSTEQSSPGPAVARLPVLLSRLSTAPFDRLAELGLPVEDFVIAGSAPFYLRGLREEISDLDIVARGLAWQRAMELGRPQPAPYGGTRAIRLVDGRFEVLDGWFPELFGDVGQLLARAEPIGALRFLTMADTVRWKRWLDRPKDRADLQRLARGR
ncbi:hypothetical protein P3T36_002937 [Kitasatospora sp. MAP12-15]|uniref:hypothetical protein n=1 Tax=unclassified Kitasatospora TaxID=2633591 RepID=UPI002476C32D|nr:hypothetical protein [Kitasatospora sp. MAP12-44]MDH6114116.1 hypothetical protein [Kitasatospora sp. MAP12-44]